MVEHVVVGRGVEHVRGDAGDHVGVSRLDRAGGVQHADDAGCAAIQTLEEPARRQAEVLGQRGHVVGRKDEGGGGQTVHVAHREPGGPERDVQCLPEHALDRSVGALLVGGLARADDEHTVISRGMRQVSCLPDHL